MPTTVEYTRNRSWPIAISSFGASLFIINSRLFLKGLALVFLVISSAFSQVKVTQSLYLENKLDPDRFLSFDYWKRSRARKDKDPQWRRKEKVLRQKPEMGMILQCVNVCSLKKRDEIFLEAKSLFYKGDTIQTRENSYLWLMLLDGSLIRLSPHSTLALKDVVITKEKSFFLARLLEGEMYYYPSKVKEELTKEIPTDVVFYPLDLIKANYSYYQRQAMAQEKGLHAKIMSLYDSSQALEGYQNAFNLQQQAVQNSRETTLLLSSGYNLIQSTHAAFAYSISGKAGYLYRHQVELDNEQIKPSLKYNFLAINKEVMLESQQGFSFEEESKTEFSDLKPPGLRMLLYFVSRPYPIWFARDWWVKKNYSYLYDEKSYEGEYLELNYALRVWSDENLFKRISYLWQLSTKIEREFQYYLKTLDLKSRPSKDYYQYAKLKSLEYYEDLTNSQRQDMLFMKGLEYKQRVEIEANKSLKAYSR